MRRFSTLLFAAALVAVAIPAHANKTIQAKAVADKLADANKCTTCHDGGMKKVKDGGKFHPAAKPYLPK
jgi:cytochrome c553